MTIEPLDFFVLRTPRLAANSLKELNAHRSFTKLADYLHACFQAQELRDAVAMASEPLYAELMKFLANGPSSLSPKLSVTLYKYLVRMATRPTPFGLFAGISLGQIDGGRSLFTLSGHVKPSFRFDMAFAAHLSRRALEHTDIGQHAAYVTNRSLITFDDHYRYMGYQLENSSKHYRWMRIKRNPLLDYIISFTKRKRTFQAICHHLQHAGLSDVQATQYLQTLVAKQCLIPDTEPVATRKRPLANLVETTVGLVQTDTGVFASSLREAQAVLEAIPPVIRDGYKGATFQVDLAVGMESNQLKYHTAQLITREINELMPLAQRHVPDELTDFCQRFTQRYDNREVRLLEALDPDRGIGYGDIYGGYLSGSSLLQHLGLQRKQQNDKGEKHKLNDLLMKRFSANLDKKETIELTYEDIQFLASDVRPDLSQMNTTGYGMGQLIASNTKSLDNGDFLFNLHVASIQSALPLMARFCHLDHKLETKLKECAQLEDQASPDICFAEIVFLPDNRVGNVMLRPALRDYELVITGHGTAKDDNTIPVADLFISVADGKVILRSEKMDKIIVPRLSCAHNYRTGSSLYRFLCDLQQQRASSAIRWDWGAYKDAAYLPRVTYKHLLLARARWHIAKLDEKSLLRQDPLVAIETLRTRYQLPEAVILAQGDNELFLDLTHPIAAGILINHLSYASAILFETIATTNGCPVVDSHGGVYANEIILPFKTNGRFTLPSLNRSTEQAIRRSFPPGSEWVYLKLYIGLGESDRLLTNEIARFIQQLQQEDLLSKWFFVRYNDPEHHIRIRILLKETDGKLPLQQIAAYANAHFGPALDNGVIHRIQYDTYVREIERYGGPHISICETIFHLDSEVSLRVLPCFSNEHSEQHKLVSAMIAIDDLLEALAIQPAEKLEWVTNWRDLFLLEFGGKKDLKLNLDRKYRAYRKFIEQHFNNNQRHISNYAPLGQRFASLEALELHRWVTPNIAASLTHMFVNRHFHVAQREIELIVYHFLIKSYRTNRYQIGGVHSP